MAISSAVIVAQTAAGTWAPPTYARDRPAAVRCRATISSSSSSSPPACSTRSTQRGVVDPEPTLHPGSLGPAAYGLRVGPAAEQQSEPGDDHGLAGPGLAGDHRQPGVQRQRRFADHPEIGDPQLVDHLPGPAAGQRDARVSAAPRQPSTRSPNLFTSRSVNGASDSRASRS